MALVPTAWAPLTASSSQSPHRLSFRNAPTPSVKASRTHHPRFALSTPRRASTAARAASSPAETPSLDSKSAGGGVEGEEEDNEIDPVQRVADDPVLLARAESRQAWSPPRMSLGDQILDVLYMFGGLLDRPFGSGQIIAAAGSVVVEKVRAEIGAVLPGETRSEGPATPEASSAWGAPGVAPIQATSDVSAIMADTSPERQKKVQVCFEILRLMQLLSVDLELLRAAVKEETLLPRLESAKNRCKQAMSLASQL